MSQSQTRIATANEFTNVKDVKGMFLYTRDNYIYCYLQVPYFSIDLLPEAEKESKTNIVSKGMKEDRKQFVYHTFPREINLDDYKGELKEKYRNELSSPGMKYILSEMIKEAVELSSNGENYEHQHYIKLWTKIGRDKGDSERALKHRAEEFQSCYQSIGINLDIIKEQAILKMCNLFGNATQAPFEDMDNYVYETSLRI